MPNTQTTHPTALTEKEKSFLNDLLVPEWEYAVELDEDARAAEIALLMKKLGLFC